MTRVNDNPNPKRSLSQKKQILQYLRYGGTLTPKEAMQKFGTMKLATRISELRGEDKWPILDRFVEIVEGPNKYRVKEYYMDPDATATLFD